ncbi:hypothetical protein [Paraburkholderia sp. WSM4177]|uniref:hypothetical protein n=1 Tax=unclassified Paraburkholderia TaxID=2615204 RepID=UPI00390595D6
MYARMNPADPAYDSSFPLPVNVSAKGSGVSNRWIAAEVDTWIPSTLSSSTRLRQRKSTSVQRSPAHSSRRAPVISRPCR